LRLRITTLLLLILALLALARCAGNPPPPPAVTPEGDARYLVDPRIGYSRPVAPVLDERMGQAWGYLLAGQYTEAQRRFADIRVKNPDYAPAILADAAVDIPQGKLDRARAVVQKALDRVPHYTAAEIYDAEISMAEQQPRAALDIYRRVIARPEAPAIAKTRAQEIESRLFDQLVQQAGAASGAEGVRLLREALTLRPGDTQARILLVQRLVAEKSYDDARRELDPLLNSGEVDRSEVQEALAEIDAGRGRFQEAIVRYERLVRRQKDPRFTRRLDELKEQFAAANMPPQFQRAVESENLTRADFAVLLYWKVSSVRFAQNLGAPPIAIDVAEVAGREELVRAIAVGLFFVDPVTRRVDPYRPVNAGMLARLAARTLSLRGASCTKSASPDPSELLRAEKVLAACGVTDPAAIGPDLPVSGKVAADVLEQVDRAVGR